MEPFDNFERWKKLKEIIPKDRDLVSIIQNILRYGTTKSHLNKLDYNLSNCELIASGRSREVYRLGKKTIEIDSQRMILAIKLTTGHVDYKFIYNDEKELNDPEILEKKFEVIALNYEVQKFEYLAKLGREIPRVTGIVAGYGIIATLTEDLSEGGLYELEVNTSGASGIVKSSRDGKQHQVVCADLKCEFPPDIQIRMLTSKQEMNIESNYFLERLQIDKS
ncbi:hypothetical protein J4230_03275 [Candidatus Woesearchaeota archaeon]|nr:hypothetical protein [Candidatus Woesearchaeota archaeon]